MIDPNKRRKIIVVHGVQVGDNDDLHQDEAVKKLFENRRGNFSVDADVDLYKYEDLNNEVLDPLQKLVSYIITNPIGDKLAQAAMDLVGDVVISLSKNKTSEKIRQGLEDKIMGYYNNGHAVYVVAHSLGTVYSFDVINRLMQRDELFDADNILTWPVLSWLTMGSPLGLGMFKATGRKELTDLGDGENLFRWRNYFDRNDPVVSGNIFGADTDITQVAEEYYKDNDEQGWDMDDYAVNTGKQHMLAHVAYWEVPIVGEGIVDMVNEILLGESE